eukprot:CAMPEP_0179431530 /NCGR_PEP_ID=MMETSP0799-20121207/16401_1 /TAXON_ID=46947 /ORGANISM="Geminigera cryophila, Strain CCMP2564" /LENGTH=83 /DNA_ID=CAMNT_0021208515 /DNA_START=222 /DNA_END=473 /DNA_ORIENTATION=+
MTLPSDASAIAVPTQGFNVFGALTQSDCAGDAAPGNIYCLGKYKDDAAAENPGDNDAKMKASYIGREWINLAPFDAAAPGGAS